MKITNFASLFNVLSRQTFPDRQRNASRPLPEQRLVGLPAAFSPPRRRRFAVIHLRRAISECPIFMKINDKY